MHLPKYDDQTLAIQLSIAYTFLEYWIIHREIIQ
jgi:hypothetical protein